MIVPTTKLLNDMVNSVAHMTVDDAVEHDLAIFVATKNRTMMSLGPEGVAALVVRYNLNAYFDHFIEFNTSHNAPYHNAYHAFCMILNCFEGAYHEQLEESDCRALLVAAMFHDFDHSAGKTDDTINIARALEGLKLANSYAKYRCMPLTYHELSVAIDCIRITKYPYEAEPTTAAQKIIRDADFMQVYEKDKAVCLKQYQGLKVEIEIARNTSYTNEEFGQGMKDWFKVSYYWYTTWAQVKAQDLDNLLACDVLIKNFKELNE